MDPAKLCISHNPNVKSGAKFIIRNKPCNRNVLQEAPATYDDDQGYVGFGFDGWQSGVQSFPDLTQVNSFASSHLPRSFPLGKFEKLLTSSLHELEGAISIERRS